jgi:hypothetical protein
MSTNKKVKRMCNFNDNWLTNEKYKEFLEKMMKIQRIVNYVTFHLQLNTMASILLIHIRRENKHKNALIGKRLTNPINNFFVTKETSEEKRVIASEVAMIHHNVQHNLSYNSLDCNLKMISKLFDDSKIAKKMSCGRTKSEMCCFPILLKQTFRSWRTRSFRLQSMLLIRGT